MWLSWQNWCSEVGHLLLPDVQGQLQDKVSSSMHYFPKVSVGHSEKQDSAWVSVWFDPAGLDLHSPGVNIWLADAGRNKVMTIP